MRNWEYAQEPFDLKLFILKCIKKIWLVILWMAVGSALFGGIYYYRNVMKAGDAPYQLTNKYYLHYAVDPSDQQTYSYFAGYTWTDLIQSDAALTRIKESIRTAGFSVGITDDAFLRSSYEARLESDLRILYVTVTGEKKDFVKALSRAIEWEMSLFADEHDEIWRVDLMTTGEPTLAEPDVRTFRAFVLGAVLGGFFAVFRIGFSLILSKEISVPATLYVRFGLPVLGYLDTKGIPHLGVAQDAVEIFREDRRIAVTSVDPGMNLDSLKKCLEDAMTTKNAGEMAETTTETAGELAETETKQITRSEIAVVPSILTNPEGLSTLRTKDGVVLAVKAETNNGSAIAHVMMEMEQSGVPVKAMVLMNGDNRFISAYLFGKKSEIRRKKL